MDTVDELIKGQNNYRLLIMELIDQTEQKVPEKSRRSHEKEGGEPHEGSDPNKKFSNLKEKFMSRLVAPTPGTSQQAPTASGATSPMKMNWFNKNKGAN